jgi:hypothetical protein
MTEVVVARHLFPIGQCSSMSTLQQGASSGFTGIPSWCECSSIAVCPSAPSAVFVMSIRPYHHRFCFSESAECCLLSKLGLVQSRECVGEVIVARPLFLNLQYFMEYTQYTASALSATVPNLLLLIVADCCLPTQLCVRVAGRQRRSCPCRHVPP